MIYFLIAIIIIILIILVWFITTTNKIKKLMIKIDESASEIDSSLMKRYDVLTKMVDVVKNYTKYESDVLTKTIKLRQNMTIKEKVQTNEEINKSIEQIRIIAENYPELKSSNNYDTLQKSITEVEENLQTARTLYNSSISNYNQFVVTFPNSIVAKLKALSKKEFFEIDEIKKDDVKIDL